MQLRYLYCSSIIIWPFGIDSIFAQSRSQILHSHYRFLQTHLNRHKIMNQKFNENQI